MLTPALALLGLTQTPVSLIRNGDFAAPLDADWRLSGVEAERVTGGDGTVALRLRFAAKADAQPWDHVVHHVNVAPIAEGDVVLFTAKVRSQTSSRIGVNYELAAPPNSKFISNVENLSPVWKEIRVAGRAGRSFAPGEAQLALFFGYGRGEAELANVRVENLGKVDLQKVQGSLDYYGGLPNPDSWRRDALQRIEKIRKAGLTVRVVDRTGKAVPNAKVSVQQIRHAFKFGTAVPAARITGTSPDDVKFRETLERLFNTVTFENDLKWNRLRDQDYTQVDAALKWLHARNFDVRGHNLAWGSYRWLPPEIRSATPEEARRLIEERVRVATRRFKGRLYLWDVVNEAVTETELWDRVGWNVFTDTFKWARQEDPKALLCYNDYNITEENQTGPGHRLKAIERIRQIQRAGAPLDVIGIQAHVGTPITPTKRVLEILDEMAKLGPRLEITEYDLGVTDDKVNGEHLRDFLTACFSHPAMDAFIMWGFYEGSHWRANEGGAIFRRDWTPRPAARIWEDLVKRQWWTNAAANTGGKGEARFRPFLGTHRVTVSVNGRTVSQTVEVKKGKGSIEIRL
ncbi:MAG: endo-1,4-beta-xylanase [Fimbriimonas sp.]